MESTSVQYTLLENFRYERKFRPESMSLAQVKNEVFVSKAFFRNIYKPRYVNNLYFDTPEFDCYYDNIGGKSQRKKYRIRWYGDKTGLISGAILEIKIKDAYRGTKTSCFLPDFYLNNEISNTFFKDLIRKSEAPQGVMDEFLGLELKLMNRYKREYYRDLSGHFRLTIDSEIEYTRLRDNLNSLSDTFIDNGVIVEIKYDEEHNETAASVINTMPFRMTRNSKYVDGIAGFYEVRS